jgi:hypothetical protein
VSPERLVEAAGRLGKVLVAMKEVEVG